MRKASYSRRFRFFGHKIRFFGYIEINKPKECRAIRQALKEIFSELDKEEGSRQIVKNRVIAR